MAKRISDQSVLGASTRVAGRIHGEGDLRVEGDVRGDVTVTGAVEITSGGRVEGNVSAEALELSGSLTGDVHARGPIVIQSGAVVSGELRGTRIAVQPGAEVRARLDMDFELELGAQRRR